MDTSISLKKASKSSVSRDSMIIGNIMDGWMDVWMDGEGMINRLMNG